MYSTDRDGLALRFSVNVASLFCRQSYERLARRSAHVARSHAPCFGLLMNRRRLSAAVSDFASILAVVASSCRACSASSMPTSLADAQLQPRPHPCRVAADHRCRPATSVYSHSVRLASAAAPPALRRPRSCIQRLNLHLHLTNCVASPDAAQLLPGFAVAVLNVPRLSPRRMSASFVSIFISNLVSFDRHAISNVSMPHALRSSLLSAPLYSSLCPSLPLLPTPSLSRL